jgi:hypothetical protein
VATEALLDARPQRVLHVSAGHEVPAAQIDSLLAEATVHLVLAYDAIDQFSEKSSMPWRSSTFVRTCRLLCATLVAIDEFSESVWTDH